VYFIYDYFYPAYKAGGPIQSLVNLVNEIGDELDISVVCSSKDMDGTNLPIQPDKWNPVKNTCVFYSSKGFKSYSLALDKDTDVILFINGIFSWNYNFMPLLFFKARRIVSVRGMLHPEALAQKPLKKSIYLRILKWIQLKKKFEFHATSEQEKGFIEKVFGNKVKVWVIPNLPKRFLYHLPPQKNEGQLVLATVALISPMKNHLLVLKALQLCKYKITYHIYGPVKDEDYWQSCLKIIGKMPANVFVKYMGDIASDKIEQVLSEIHVYIQPSKSENFGHSLYEALAVGRPIITSNNTPWNNLEANKAGCNIEPRNIEQLSKQIDFFAEMANEVFKDYSQCARRFAENSINIPDIKREYLRMFKGNPGNEKVHINKLNLEQTSS
jgi:glycosyltransferase involved in cell wall biosynthesis